MKHPIPSNLTSEDLGGPRRTSEGPRRNLGGPRRTSEGLGRIPQIRPGMFLFVSLKDLHVFVCSFNYHVVFFCFFFFYFFRVFEEICMFCVVSFCFFRSVCFFVSFHVFLLFSCIAIDVLVFCLFSCLKTDCLAFYMCSCFLEIFKFCSQIAFFFACARCWC